MHNAEIGMFFFFFFFFFFTLSCRNDVTTATTCCVLLSRWSKVNWFISRWFRLIGLFAKNKRTHVKMKNCCFNLYIDSTAHSHRLHQQTEKKCNHLQTLYALSLSHTHLHTQTIFNLCVCPARAYEPLKRMDFFCRSTLAVLPKSVSEKTYYFEQPTTLTQFQSFGLAYSNQCRYRYR